MSKKVGKLVLIRHGESQWNALGKWTGLTDVELSEKGHADSHEVGKIVKDIAFTRAFSSELQRTQQTLKGILRGSEQLSVAHEISPHLNERDYGIYTGKNKWEVKDLIGEAEFHRLRRGWDHPVPEGETLKAVYERAVPFYKDQVLPKLLQGHNVLIVAHGNTLRSIIKYIEGIDDRQIAELEMEFNTALIYEVNEHGRLLSKSERRLPSL